MVKQTVRIIADATIDLPPNWVIDLNIGILPTQIIFPNRDKPFRNYIDITTEEFYEKLNTVDEIPTTAVPKQGDIYQIYDDSLKKYDSLLVLTHSNKISGSYNSAKKVADMFTNKDITVLDTQTITVMEGMLVYEAAKMAREGEKKDAIVKKITELLPHTHGVAILKSLDHLRKGGRISLTKHLLANLANCRPIITSEDGLIKTINKVKGFDTGVAIFKEQIPNILKNRKTDLVVVFHALMYKEAVELKEHILTQTVNVPKIVEIFMIGPVLGTHMGPYNVGIAWIGDWDEKWFS